MIERLVIAGILVVVGVLPFRLTQWWSLRRHEGFAPGDTLLQRFAPGRPAVLYFTSEHCMPCRTQQRPALARLRSELGQDTFQIIEVDAEHERDHAERWGVMTLPTTFILDSEGKSQAVNYGVTSAQKLAKQITQQVS
jgi:thiol-disulfide isomerase/thioredoxin